MNLSQYVVVGAGLAGAATAWQLAARGYEVTILERSTPAHAGGSSHGSARIFRFAYPKALYTRLVVEAGAGWEELARLGGKQLITPTGAIDHGSGRDPERLAEVLAAHDIAHELLDAGQARARWPQFAFDSPVLWHPDAGVIDAAATVDTMIALAQADGARLLNGWEVARVAGSRRGYRITSSSGDVIDAGNIVISAGGWLPDVLVNLPLPAAFLAGIPPLQVRQEQAYHFPYRALPDSGAPWPSFIHKTAAIQTYGLPGGRDAGYRGHKIAEFNGGKIIRSAAAQDGRVDPDNRKRIIDYVRSHLPGLVPEPYAETTCLFTNTPDEDFIIDRAANITVLSPCSGHGAKFAPLIGQFAADLATGVGTVPEEFRLPVSAV